MKVVFWSRIGLAREQIVARLGTMPGVELIVAHDEPELLAGLAGARLLITPDAANPEQARRISEALTRHQHRLSHLHLISAGHENFDAVGFPVGLAVTRTEGTTAGMVAEHAVALLLALSRRLPETLAEQAREQWSPVTVAALQGLAGGICLVVGTGAIGRAVARLVRALGMQAVGVTRTPRTLVDFDHTLCHSDWHDALPSARAVILCCPLTPETRSMLGTAELTLMSPQALLVNVGRGGLVDTDALVAALERRVIGGAGLDVTAPEPLPASHPLWRAPRVILTPHVAARGSLAALERIADEAASVAAGVLAERPSAMVR